MTSDATIAILEEAYIRVAMTQIPIESINFEEVQLKWCAMKGCYF